ncbi:UNKNOWN [Stylonychia lemnae]|uniref:Uncharacterized protein n=1 Tax=Stylonychia lemnae TaxID=5949 RepID=A0A078A495_STYLE|nr:UNKNOWN [Stylonychia lemnae]|eukprot:CDW75579.1 UNKNOWN [Stylonychia lemnae]
MFSGRFAAIIMLVLAAIMILNSSAMKLSSSLNNLKTAAQLKSKTKMNSQYNLPPDWKPFGGVYAQSQDSSE